MDMIALDAAADALRSAKAVVFATGAGMGVDSGLPDFRGNEGFWRAYPMLGNLGVSFAEMANPRWFAKDPSLAWGFYGHRLMLYRQTTPHDGYAAILRMQEAGGFELFSYTSNVDGQLQSAGYAEEAIVECHGSIHHLQCVRSCRERVWSADFLEVEVDPKTLRATSEIPPCQHCSSLARPAILMFGDGGWVDVRTNAQFDRFATFLQGHSGPGLVVLEVGAGVHVPNVRYQSERLMQALGATLIRVNPRDPEGPKGTISVRGGGKEALLAIETRVRKG